MIEELDFQNLRMQDLGPILEIIQKTHGLFSWEFVKLVNFVWNVREVGVDGNFVSYFCKIGLTKWDLWWVKLEISWVLLCEISEVDSFRILFSVKVFKFVNLPFLGSNPEFENILVLEKRIRNDYFEAFFRQIASLQEF